MRVKSSVVKNTLFSVYLVKWPNKLECKITLGWKILWGKKHWLIYQSNLLPFQGNTIILCYKKQSYITLLITVGWQNITIFKSFITLAHRGKLKYRRILPWNFNPRKCSYCCKLPRYFYNIVPCPLNVSWDCFNDFYQFNGRLEFLLVTLWSTNL